jgi:transposase
MIYRTPLHRVEGNLTGIIYRDDILQRFALPTLQNIGYGAVLQDDNARPHRAHVVNDFLQQQHVTRMDWPAFSPDLNCIEHLWDVLGRSARANHPPVGNLNQLFQNLQQEWQAIPQNTIRRLILSMRHRCLACITARGGHTLY